MYCNGIDVLSNAIHCSLIMLSSELSLCSNSQSYLTKKISYGSNSFTLTEWADKENLYFDINGLRELAYILMTHTFTASHIPAWKCFKFTIKYYDSLINN